MTLLVTVGLNRPFTFGRRTLFARHPVERTKNGEITRRVSLEYSTDRPHSDAIFGRAYAG
jgi:hypothetical protein